MDLYSFYSNIAIAFPDSITFNSDGECKNEHEWTKKQINRK